MVQSARNYNDDVINFYDEQLVPRADMVYRFAFAASLNLDSASRLVRQTFEDIAMNADALHRKGGNNLNADLLTVCWNHFRNSRDKSSPQSKSQVVRVLNDLTVEERVILVAVDVLGLSAAEAQSVVGVDEKVLRKNLANARRVLMASALEM